MSKKRSGNGLAFIEAIDELSKSNCWRDLWITVHFNGETIRGERELGLAKAIKKYAVDRDPSCGSWNFKAKRYEPQDIYTDIPGLEVELWLRNPG